MNSYSSKNWKVRGNLIGAFLLLGISWEVYGVEFDNPYNHYAGGEIKAFKVFGERCSGTNFLRCLLQANFPSFISYDYPPGYYIFGHKHFIWWLDAPIHWLTLKIIKHLHNSVDLSQSQDYLFVVVVREPYDWLRSFYLGPHYVHPDLLGNGFFYFISSTWKVIRDEQRFDIVDDCNPWTGLPFPNVLVLRKYKTLNFLKLGTRVNNYLFVRYEDVRDHPEEFIDFVATHYNLVKKDAFIPITTYKGLDDIPFSRKQYSPIEPDDLAFINSQIDWDLENGIGYFPKESVE